MNLNEFPANIRPLIIPKSEGRMEYQCLACRKTHSIDSLLYTCPDCGGVLLIHDLEENKKKQRSGQTWRRLFDYRRMSTLPALKGIFTFHEFIAPVIPLDKILYLGEGHTPLVSANPDLQEQIGIPFVFKNEGQNPSASFKDRGMACALSYLNYLISKKNLKNVLAICASTGDTSASGALYASYLGETVRSAVLLPKGKVTPQQLSQPLGSGARVLEIPGVFDDCMKVVEYLADHYPVALLNSKNAWRILGQESYAFEVAQALDYDLEGIVLFVPIGNAGNITAIIAGFLKLYRYGLIHTLPKIIGVQSHHANPVYRYYLEPRKNKRKFKPVPVRPSVAQAAMIGNPVSMPRVIEMVEEYNQTNQKQKIFVVEVSEQSIMDHMLLANRNGHIACTQGGESLAGLVRALVEKKVSRREKAILNATAHALKFSGFQEMYFQNTFPADFGVRPKKKLQNHPVFAGLSAKKSFPGSGIFRSDKEYKVFIEKTALNIAKLLDI
ncbi:MAG: threonine synthase [Thermodesulfobacteriota bacterium]